MAGAPKLTGLPTLDELCEQPALAGSLTPDATRRLLTQLNARLASAQTVRDALLLRLATVNSGGQVTPPKSRTLNADQIAAALGINRRQAFTLAKKVPCIKRISRKTLVTDEAELLRWRALQQ